MINSLKNCFEQEMRFSAALRLLNFPEDVTISAQQKGDALFRSSELVRDESGDEHYLLNMRLLRNASPNLSTIPKVAQINKLKGDTDFLYEDLLKIELGQYGFFRAINLALMSVIEPKATCALVASVRNEGPFLVEWLAHHRAIGIADIFIYTNDNSDGSTKLLKALAAHGVLKLFLNETSLAANPQIKAYEHSLHFLPELRSFEWVAYLDADEFLIPAIRYDHHIANLIGDVNKQISSQALACVCFNWLWMGSAGAIYREDKPVTERFQYGGLRSNFVKSLIRPRGTLSMRGVHKPILGADYYGVNSSYKKIPMAGHATPFDFSGGRINHYWNKSFQEFLVKQSRGRDRPIWERGTELFFNWDIAASDATFAPFPDRLASRVRQEQEFILSLPGVRELQRDLIGTYKSIDAQFCDAEHLFKEYIKEKNRSSIISCLNKVQTEQNVDYGERAAFFLELLSKL
jgi:hypothetical protein